MENNKACGSIASLSNIFNAGTGTAAGTITISVAEFSRLKDIETRFEIMRREMLDSSYVPTHYQIILGIEEELKEHALEKEIHKYVKPKKNNNEQQEQKESETK